MLRSLVILTTAALAAATPHITKRCSPARDPEWYRGYLPPVACWQDQDTACQAYIAKGTDLVIDSKHKLAVVYGVSSYCEEIIAEELARAADGRKTYGWLEKHGTLTVIEGGILVISGMSDEAVGRYEALTYYEYDG
ncbi:uncharacterized protein DNG_07097 [Cephalotrichum gorgonifer]|uniref:Uncharacterized protein n=1 Tax=Cephalotrichum gorgonifer TaxID=2041049 RepID=A0AAE8SXW8_9PEZI|nr:uncharacterized protein DNG_07097 [Cephalotrichum gorgonifer]